MSKSATVPAQCPLTSIGNGTEKFPCVMLWNVSMSTRLQSKVLRFRLFTEYNYSIVNCNNGLITSISAMCNASKQPVLTEGNMMKLWYHNITWWRRPLNSHVQNCFNTDRCRIRILWHPYGGPSHQLKLVLHTPVKTQAIAIRWPY